MLKKRIINKIYLTTFIFFLLLVVSTFSKNDTIANTRVEYRSNISTIYLLNESNYLVEVGILVEDDLIKSVNTIINNLKSGSKYHNGLRGILPSNTILNSIDINEGILSLDFNKSLLEVNSSLEETVIESLVFSLMNLKGIEGIRISINNELLDVLPKSNIKLNSILTKDFGINKDYCLTSMNDIKRVVLYYYQELNDQRYYVPITKYVNDKNDKIKIIIDNLKSSYLYKTNLLSYLNEKIQVFEYEYKNNLVTISFNNLYDINMDNLEEELIYTFSNSIFLSTDIDKIIFLENDNLLMVKNR